MLTGTCLLLNSLLSRSLLKSSNLLFCVKSFIYLFILGL
uniref:Uncharacterized protein n=1 Tax=Rhizophora mucronata TaxID=61149 RepID=A0A2P2PDH9_RHIMU